MRKNNFCLFVCLVFLLPCSIDAQVNLLYYMENVPARNILNPAFIPSQKFYIDLPVISGVAFSVGNNSVSAQDIVVKKGDELLPELQSNADHSPFLNKLKATINFTSESRVNLLGFGFRLPEGYFTFDISERNRVGINIPKSLVRLGFDGAPVALETKSYNLHKIGCDASAYLEMAFGYSRKIDDSWIVGGKMKVLFGEAHADLAFSELGIDVGDQYIDLYGKGKARFTSPVAVSQRSDGLPYIRQEDVKLNKMLHPVGFGLGLDAGVAYRYDDRLQFSGSIDDIGFIRWKKSDWEGNLNAHTSYKSWDFTVDNATSNWGQQVGDSLKNSYTSTFDAAHGYVKALTATVRLGADYDLVKKKVNLGLLCVKTFGGRYRYNEVLASVNFRPFYWFNTSVGYGLINGNMGSLGLGLNLIGGPFNFFVATDYMPLSYTSNNIPYKSKYVNGHVGVSLTFKDRIRKPLCHCE